MPTRFWSSDQHFGHAGILRYCDRPYDSTDEMDADLAVRWNARVASDDEVWVVGDWTLGNADRARRALDGLAGSKILVIGNHDKPFRHRHRSRPDRDAEWLAAGFDRLVHGSTTTTLADGRVAIVNHFPPEGDTGPQDRHRSHRPPHRGDFDVVVHGHVHELWRVRGSWVNVGVDVWGGFPVTDAELIEALDAGDSGRLSWGRHGDWPA